MAKIEQIPILGRMSGRVGDLVVRRYSDKYVVAAMPIISKPRTEKQKAQSQRFAKAMDWAKDATRDPPTKGLYDRAVADVDRASNTAAVSDYLRPPRIVRVDLNDYTGQAGTVLSLRVNNVIPVRQVAVFILPANDDDADDTRDDDTDDVTADTGDHDEIEIISPASDLASIHEGALELGLASPAGSEGGKDGVWSYTTKTDVGADRGGEVTVLVRVTDHPGNMVEERVELTL